MPLAARPHAPVPPTRVLVGAVLGTVAGVLPAFLVGAVAVQARADLGFSRSELGFLVATPFAAAALSSVALGRVAERLGPERALRGTSAAAALVMVGLALAPGTAALALGLAAAGVVNAMAQPAANLLVARGVDPARQGLAFGLKQSAMPASTMLAGLAVPLVALTVGWRWAFAAGAGLALLAVAAVPPIAAGPSAVPPRPSAVPPRPDPAGTARRPRADVARRPMLVLAIGVGFGAAAAGALAGFLVSAGVDAGLSEGVAGLALTLGSLVGIGVRVIVGARADRRDGGHLRVVAGMLAGGAGAFLLLAVGSAGALLLAVPVAFGAGWAWPGLFNFAVVRHNPSAPAAATGFTQTGTYLGAMAGPVAFGAAAEAWGYDAAWELGALWYLAAAAAIVGGRHLLRQARDAAPVA